LEDPSEKRLSPGVLVTAKESRALICNVGVYNSPVMSFLRFFMVLSLVVWIGGLIFFAFVLAPTAFQVLPSTHLAGNVVGRALGKLHWIGIISGVVFLTASLLYSYLTQGTAHIFAMRHVLLCLMLALTLFSQFWIIPRMDTLRASVGDFATVPLTDPARVQFDALHVWSTRVESAVLVLGLAAIYLTASALSNPR
jgi:uncharacterized membrane protein